MGENVFKKKSFKKSFFIYVKIILILISFFCFIIIISIVRVKDFYLFFEIWYCLFVCFLWFIIYKIDIKSK